MHTLDRSLAIGTLLIALVVALRVATAPTVAAPTPAKVRWQYATLTEGGVQGPYQQTFFAGGVHTEDLAGKDPGQAFGARMAKMGADGWELVGISTFNEKNAYSDTTYVGTDYVFKRALP